jgi:hypothetical protein
LLLFRFAAACLCVGDCYLGAIFAAIVGHFGQQTGTPRQIQLFGKELWINETHLAFEIDDTSAAQRLHTQMECIRNENEGMELYFILDPDGC